MQAVFLDRDGTIGGTGGGMHPDRFSMYDFSPASIKTLNESGLKVFSFYESDTSGKRVFYRESIA
ncbi:MAG: hypothetical protein ACQEUT_09575 [Bacillota bacterium]